ncbi:MULTISPECIES: GNAT family N-acetyltransferase [unclassified Plantibacter]|uniref:GNAT family N-acetyltransferase n=1 Tax=unclassified Plantibacter TaxID=2624265 RepID=UPI001783EDCA|nr:MULTISPECIES: GNAT family protein [unclassified Plantibacter]MBD8101260.1 GNAT family N-acetyltransferase [Plantibacter sp. CFBP 8775]MBD8518506.1 GNAT family N-acetyltransferase [Plantibacter sp. CFBP 8804]
MVDTFLRPWDADDAQSLHAAFVENVDLAPQFGHADLSTVQDAVQFIERALTSSESRLNWAVVRNGSVVGNVGVSAIDRRHSTAWLSYWLIAGARGSGLATRAVRTVADHAFREGLFRLELGHRVNNPASCGVATRAGFLAEGIERQKLAYGDDRFDVELHARLATDPAPDGDLLFPVR